MYTSPAHNGKSKRNCFVGLNLMIFLAGCAATATTFPNRFLAVAGLARFSISFPWRNETLNMLFSFKVSRATVSTARRAVSTTSWRTPHFEATAWRNKDSLLGLPRGVPGAGCEALPHISLSAVFALLFDLARIALNVLVAGASCDGELSASMVG